MDWADLTVHIPPDLRFFLPARRRGRVYWPGAHHQNLQEIVHQACQASPRHH